MADAVGYICAVLIIVLFWGEPDLHDAMILAWGVPVPCKVDQHQKQSYLPRLP